MYSSPWGCTCTDGYDGYGHDDGVGQHIIYQHSESMMYDKHVQAKEMWPHLTHTTKSATDPVYHMWIVR